jgi:hypothetical protein
MGNVIRINCLNFAILRFHFMQSSHNVMSIMHKS